MVKLSVALLAAAAAVDLDSPMLGLEVRWGAYMSKFDKTYSAEKQESAFAAFQANDAIIQEHNAKGLSWTLGHNKFSDMSFEEFKATHLGLQVDLNRPKDFAVIDQNATYADAIDWVSKGAVSPVKNQEQCGSCWAFSTVGAVEGAFQIAGNPLTQFSEQDLVSCDNSAHGGSDQGCNGGLMDNAFTWISKNGLCAENDYPYTSGGGNSGTCKTSCSPAVTLTGHKDVNGESGMIPALNVGPVSVAIEADKSTFQLYKGGVLDDSGCGTQLDHGVLAVGYGTDGGKAYYKVKNSWGSSWGESGYIRMVQGKDQCGIAKSASYPTGVKAAAPPAPTPPTPPTPAPAPASKFKCNLLKAQCEPSDTGKFTSEALCSAICII